MTRRASRNRLGTSREPRAANGSHGYEPTGPCSLTAVCSRALNSFGRQSLVSRPMPFPRISLRTLMIAVAVAGVLLGGAVEVRRITRRITVYERRAKYHAREEQGYRRQLDRIPLLLEALRSQAREATGFEAEMLARKLVEFEQDLVFSRREAAHHARMKQAYER